jgi:hypothetical protein
VPVPEVVAVVNSVDWTRVVLVLPN